MAQHVLNEIFNRLEYTKGVYNATLLALRTGLKETTHAASGFAGGLFTFSTEARTRGKLGGVVGGALRAV